MNAVVLIFFILNLIASVLIMETFRDVFRTYASVSIGYIVTTIPTIMVLLITDGRRARVGGNNTTIENSKLTTYESGAIFRTAGYGAQDSDYG